MADYEFDPEAYGSGEQAPAATFDPESYAKDHPPQAQPQPLPTVKPKLQTYYFPATPEETRAAGLSYKMEGGIHGAGNFSSLDLRDHTIEKYRSGESPYVAVAMPGFPTGAEFMTPINGELAHAKNVDTGGGLREGQQDVATSNPDLARGYSHFDPSAYGEGKPAFSSSVPDINAFLEPPAPEPEAAPTPEEDPYAAVGKAISKGASAVGAAMSKPAPQLQFGSHEIRQAFNQPTEAAQVNAMVGNTAPAIPMPTPSPMPTPQYQPQQAAPVMQGTMEGLQQTAAGLVPHTMEQFKGLATVLGAPTDPGAFFNAALQQGLVTSKIAQDAIKAGPLSKEAGLAYGTIIPQALMAYGGLSAAGAAPSAATIGRSLIGQNILPRARESGAIGATGAPQGISGQAAITSTREVPVPESLQPHERPDFERGSIHINVRGNEIDPSRPLSGWVLPAELGDNPNTMSTRYGRAGLTAVYVPKEFVQRSKTRPARIKEGYIPPPENVAVIPPEAVRPSGTIDWTKVFKRDQPTAPPTGGSGTVPWNGQGTPPQPPAPPVAPPPAGGVPPQPPKSVPEMLRNSQIKDRIVSGKNSAFTFADYEASQRTNPLRQEFGERTTESPKTQNNIKADKDMEAATIITEAQGSKLALKQDLELVKTSKNKKLGEEMAAKYQYALDNFDRVSKIQNRASKLMSDVYAEDQASGITYSEREGYASHALAHEPESTLMSFFTGRQGAGGLSKYFTKSRTFDTLAQAIHEGIRPASLNIADLAQHRIVTSRKLILQKALFNELKSIKAPDGNSVVRGVYRMPEPPHPAVVPPGYELFNANGTEIMVHRDYAGIFKSLYGDSAIRRTATGRTLMRAVGLEKAMKLAADTFHGMRGIMKGAAYGKGTGRIGYNRGVSVYELSDEALQTAVKNGEITQSQADYAKGARPAVEEMMKNGLNVSRYADNLVGQMHTQIPGISRVNNWIFQRVFKGSMLQASHANFIRNLSRFPELTRREVARKTAKEMNEVFGSLQDQGLIRDKTVRDASNVILLAPQWIESQARAEFRGYGQIGKIIPDALRGKYRVGVVAQGQATAVLAYLLGNQIINYATTGHSTFQNEHHKLSAFLPIGERGVYISPLALSAEIMDHLTSTMGRDNFKGNIGTAITEMMMNKLHPFTRGVVTLATQHDWRGRRLEGADIPKQVAADVAPVPIAAGQLANMVELNPNSPSGFNFKADQMAKGLLQSMGQRGELGPRGAQQQRAPAAIKRPRRTRQVRAQGVY